MMRPKVKARGPNMMRTTFIHFLFLLFAGLWMVPEGVAQDAKKEAEAEAQYLGANALFNRGDYARAIAEYEGFLKQFPDHPKAANVRYGLGLCYFQTRKYQEAAALLGEVAKQPNAPDAARLNLFRGQALQMLKQYAEAEVAFDTGIKALPANAEKALQQNLAISRLDALFHQQKWKAVASAADELKLPEGESQVRVAFQGALARYELGELQEAVPRLQKIKGAVKGTAYEQQTHFLLAESLRELGQTKEALPEYEAAARLPGGFASEALYRAGFVQFQADDFEKATASFEAFMAKYKGKGDPVREQRVQIFLGRAHLEQKAYAKAEQVFETLLTGAGAGAEAALWQGRVFQRQGKQAEAEATVASAMKRNAENPLRPDLLFDLGQHQMAQQKFAEAGQSLDQLLREFKEYDQRADAVRHNALCKHRAEDYAASLALCREFLAGNAEAVGAADMMFLEGENRFFLNQPKEAVVAYEAFIKAHDEHGQIPVARMRVGEAYFEGKEWDQALAAFEAILKTNPEGTVYDQLEFLMAECHHQKMDWAKAVELYELFAKDKPKSINADTALMKSGLASERLKQFNNAIGSYRKLAAQHAASRHVPQANFQLGVLLYEAGDMAGARVPLQAVWDLEQHDLRPNAGYYLAWVSLGEKNPAAAARRFGGISEQFPEHQLAADARLQQAIVLAAAQEHAQAQQALELFLKEHPKHEMAGQVYYQLGSALMEQKQWPAAIAQFANVPAKNDWRDDALYRSAWCERRADNKLKAIPFYKELLEQFGESNLAGHALLELVELEHEAAQFDPAIARLEAYLKANPAPADDHQAQAMYWLGWCWYGKKENELAKAKFAKLKELFPESTAAKATQPTIE